MIAAVKVRGSVDVKQNTARTLHDLKLRNKNEVVFYEQNDAILGMMNKAKDYIAYGEVSDEIIEEIEEKKDVEIEHGTTVSLAPPSGGFKGTKRNFGQGGSLGKRPNLDKLLNKMV